MIRVLIVDDHPIVRDGVTGVLAREPDIEVVGEADTLDEGLRLDARHQPDVILLDLKLPGTTPLEGVTSFAARGRGIVVFTAHDADDEVFGAIRGGARGYLLKGSPAAEIAQAIRQVHAGASYLSPRIAAKLVKDVAQPRGPHRRAERPRARRAPAGRRRPVESPDRRSAVDHGADREVPRHGDLQQARRREPRASRGASPPSEGC